MSHLVKTRCFTVRVRGRVRPQPQKNTPKNCNLHCNTSVLWTKAWMPILSFKKNIKPHFLRKKERKKKVFLKSNNPTFTPSPEAVCHCCHVLSSSPFWASYFPIKRDKSVVNELPSSFYMQTKKEKRPLILGLVTCGTSWSLVFSIFSFTRYSILCLWFLCPTSFPFSSDSWTFCLRRTSFSCLKKIER